MIKNKEIFLSSRMIEYWQSMLDITDWEISCEMISELQVVDALDGNSPGHEFVGIAIQSTAKKGTIFHTRALLEDDIIHELLHVRFPDWSEQDVNFWTNLLMKKIGTSRVLNERLLVVNQ